MKDSILIIMAGGKSSRMKQDKALLPFGGYPSLAQYQYERFKSSFAKVYLSAKENKFDFSAEIIEDCYEASSPLVALVSIFERLKEVNEVMVLSVDAPLIQKRHFETLLTRAKRESDAIIASSPRGIEPLCGIYRRTILPLAKARVKENQHRLTTLLKSIKTEKVAFAEEELFINLNYPKDYQLAKEIIAFSK